MAGEEIVKPVGTTVYEVRAERKRKLAIGGRTVPRAKQYEPRVTFALKALSTKQARELRTVLFVQRLLESRVRAEGSVRKAAKNMGVSRSFLADVLQGRKPPGYRLARAVGYAPKVLYLRIWPGLPEYWTGGKAGEQNGTGKPEARDDHDTPV
jgi:lambda repressor-like predicted transcriptional regulator